MPPSIGPLAGGDPRTRLKFLVDSPDVRYTDEAVYSRYDYRTTRVRAAAGRGVTVAPETTRYEFRTALGVPRLGLMLVGWGGNNGSTLTASMVAHCRNISWRTKDGLHTPNFFGSIVQASTVKLGTDENGEDYHIPFRDIVPMVDPRDIVIGGWDISGENLAEAVRRAKVLDYDLQRQVAPALEGLVPLPSPYYPDFIAANQAERADNVLSGTKQEHLDRIRADIREFKAANDLEAVVVVWTANTERFTEVIAGVNDTADNLLGSIKTGHPEVSPSTVFAVASILEGAPFVNGSPQNTLLPGVIDLAERRGVHVGGDDFKSGQTKLKSVLVDFLVGAGIKPLAITSYNHLGNNDGRNLSAPQQFRSKEVSKSNVVDDVVASNRVLYGKGERPGHTVVIKYVPSVGDSKRALDEYVSEIFMGGKSTIAVYNVCEDSLLAVPLILDLAVLAELMTRVRYRTDPVAPFSPFHPVLSVLSYMLKAPSVPPGTPVVNALSKQRAALENILRALVGLPPQSDMLLEHKAFQ